jgi:transcriptional regulator with XRE-family HTH domain
MQKGTAMADQPAVTFAWLLRRLRREAGFTQEQLAAEAEVSPRTVSDLERGINLRAHSYTTRALADALGLSDEARAAFEAAARARGSDDGSSSLAELRTASILASAATQENAQSPVGTVLRQLREASSLTQEAVGQGLGWSSSKLSRIENGLSIPASADLERLLDFYHSDDELRNEMLAALELARFAAGPRERSSAESKRSSQLRIPGFAGETVTGDDLLGIEKDALALAALLASSKLDPPLALDLYGD